MTKVFLLYYDRDDGNKEDWNIFYTPCEAFSSAGDRQSRIDYIKANSSRYTDDDCFHTVDLDCLASVTGPIENDFEDDEDDS